MRERRGEMTRWKKALSVVFRFLFFWMKGSGVEKKERWKGGDEKMEQEKMEMKKGKGKGKEKRREEKEGKVTVSLFFYSSSLPASFFVDFLMSILWM